MDQTLPNIKSIKSGSTEHLKKDETIFGKRVSWIKKNKVRQSRGMSKGLLVAADPFIKPKGI